MRVLCMHTARVTDSVRIRGLGLALGSYRVYHTAGRMLILHRYSLRTGIGIMRKFGMRKVKCGMQSAE